MKLKNMLLKPVMEACLGPKLALVLMLFFFFLPLAFWALPSFLCGSLFHTLPPKYKYYLGLKREREGKRQWSAPPLLSVSLRGALHASNSPSCSESHSKAPKGGRGVTEDGGGVCVFCKCWD